MMISLIGRQLDHLLVLRRSHTGGKLQWVCRCSCGNTAILRDKPLRMGWLSSCGCRDQPAHDDSVAIATKPPDHTKSPLHHVTS